VPDHANQPRRKPGRPRSDQAFSSISAWVSTPAHDRIAQLALKHQTSVSRIVRCLIEKALQRPPK
jgi:hypothetical protein